MVEPRGCGGGESVEHPRDDIQAQIRKSIGFSVLDDNTSRKIEPDELRGARFQKLKDNFAAIDANHDGGLDQAEYFAAMAPRVRAADAVKQP